jgi:hypothetical protein
LALRAQGLLPQGPPDIRVDALFAVLLKEPLSRTLYDFHGTRSYRDNSAVTGMGPSETARLQKNIAEAVRRMADAGARGAQLVALVNQDQQLVVGEEDDDDVLRSEATFAVTSTRTAGRTYAVVFGSEVPSLDRDRAIVQKPAQLTCTCVDPTNLPCVHMVCAQMALLAAEDDGPLAVAGSFPFIDFQHARRTDATGHAARVDAAGVAHAQAASSSATSSSSSSAAAAAAGPAFLASPVKVDPRARVGKHAVPAEEVKRQVRRYVDGVRALTEEARRQFAVGSAAEAALALGMVSFVRTLAHTVASPAGQRDRARDFEQSVSAEHLKTLHERAALLDAPAEAVVPPGAIAAGPRLPDLVSSRPRVLYLLTRPRSRDSPKRSRRQTKASAPSL